MIEQNNSYSLKMISLEKECERRGVSVIIAISFSNYNIRCAKNNALRNRLPQRIVVIA